MEKCDIPWEYLCYRRVSESDTVETATETRTSKKACELQTDGQLKASSLTVSGLGLVFSIVFFWCLGAWQPPNPGGLGGESQYTIYVYIYVSSFMAKGLVRYCSLARCFSVRERAL